MIAQTPEVVEAVAEAIQLHDHRNPDASYTDLARAALAAIPEPATVGGVTRDDIARLVDEGAFDFPEECEGEIEHAYNVADAILALLPAAPVRTVGSVEELEALPPMTRLELHNEMLVWAHQVQGLLDLNPGALPATILTPATTRDVGAEEVARIKAETLVEAADAMTCMHEGPCSVAWDDTCNRPMDALKVLAWLRDRAASAKGDGE